MFGNKKQLTRLQEQLELLTEKMDRLLDTLDPASGRRTRSTRRSSTEKSASSSTRSGSRRRSSGSVKSAPEISPLEGVPEFLQDFLNRRKINIKAVPEEDAADSLIDELSLTLGENYGVLSPLLATIKRAIQGTGGVRENLSGYSQSELSVVTRFCSRLHRYAFLEQYRYIKSPNCMVTARVNKMPAAQKFFNGQWLERYVLQKVKNVYETYTRESKLNIRMEVLNNPHIILPNGHNFELDVLVAFDEKIYWIEAKSGDYQTHVAKYAGFAKTLNLDTKHSMMVLTDIPESECESLSSLYPLSIYNLDIFEENFLKLVREDFDGKKKSGESSARRRPSRRRGGRKPQTDTKSDGGRDEEETKPAAAKKTTRRRTVRKTDESADTTEEKKPAAKRTTRSRRRPSAKKPE